MCSSVIRWLAGPASTLWVTRHSPRCRIGVAAGPASAGPRMAESLRVAAVDCGTNSIRLLIADYADGELTEVDRQMRIVRLGQGVDSTGSFAPQALQRTFAAASEYEAVIRTAGAARLRFVATSAARDVSNRDEFFAGISAR